MRITLAALLLINMQLNLNAQSLSPKILSVETLKDIKDSAVLFMDDFEDNIPLNQKYTEYSSPNNSCTVTDSIGCGGSKHSNRARWQQGQDDAGGLTLMFGKNPVSSKFNTTAIYSDIYWRHYVMVENGWTGNPFKLSRATILTSKNWAQAMIAHIWNSTKNDSTLIMDPTTGVKNGVVITTKYNDYTNLKWLGQKPSKTPIYSTRNTEAWFCIETHVKLNSPGKADGIFELWIDNTLEVGRYDLNWVDTWNELGINTIKLENFWNDGSPKEQNRFIDNFVISTNKIGLSPSPSNPLIYTKSNGIDPLEIQISTTKSDDYIVWSGKTVEKTVRVDNISGTFNSTNKSFLDNGEYFVRCRYNSSSTSTWSDWKAFLVLNKTTETTVQNQRLKKTSSNQSSPIQIMVQMKNQLSIHFSELSAPNIKKCYIKLYNSQGRMLLVQTTEFPAQTISFERHLTKGLYFAKVEVLLKNGNRIKSSKDVVIL